ncbi:alkaline shock response membrane anchor protein AmaP [Marinococcus sp. PL1-022]|uniref:alkaline shock response membrane anchor protein AmaP n=1 Tax=Marinococcus sp. PL1-022 TaxID=3095363 RepID=UPI0029C2CD70|nr:alkaline shock response membrane anchor protein AmaP [Marinococcus sp. PL1-022]MDX6153208.1 alkaline shock response membrane anchor protein AmaP [Marinococcus sp. PL1-022]
MNGFTRLVGFLFAVATIIFSVGALLYLFDIGASTSVIDGWISSSVGFWIIIGMAVFIGLISLVMLVASLSGSSSSAEGLKIETADGTIDITKASIRSTVHQTLKKYTELRSPQVSVQIHRRQEAVTIRTSFHLFRETGAQTLTKEVQQRVKENVEAWLEVPVRDVRVTVHEPKVDKKKARVV